MQYWFEILDYLLNNSPKSQNIVMAWWVAHLRDREQQSFRHLSYDSVCYFASKKFWSPSYSNVSVFLDWTDTRVPDFVFLGHVVDIMSSMHTPFVFRSFNSVPFSTKFFLFPMWPFTFLVMLAMWAKSKTFLFSFYNLRCRLHQTWVVPRFGFQVAALILYLLYILLNRVTSHETELSHTGILLKKNKLRISW